MIMQGLDLSVVHFYVLSAKKHGGPQSRRCGFKSCRTCIASMMINVIGVFLIPKNRKKVISIEG